MTLSSKGFNLQALSLGDGALEWVRRQQQSGEIGGELICLAGECVALNLESELLKPLIPEEARADRSGVF